MDKWWKKSVVYQIYPRSFADSNGDGIGDIKGITFHLEYLKKLGVDVIWLSPVYESPCDDNGYDISDYKKILPVFGTMEDFDEMLYKAHALGLKIVMDLVVNHTSDEHEWFKKSRSSTDNPYRDYYIWREGRDGHEPNNWGSEFGGSAWEYDATTDMYYLHLFSKKQPDLNWDNPRVRHDVYEMMTWWLKKGVDGFRMDTINLISKTEGLPDGKMSGLYGDPHPFVCDGPRVHEYLKEMNEKVLSQFDIITVGEALNTTLDQAGLYSGEDEHELNMVFHFEHVSLGEHVIGKWGHKRIPLSDLRQVLNKWQTGLSDKGWNSLYLGNHDQPREVSRFGNDSPLYRDRSAKMLATCLHMMKGTPYIYQGEELGMINPYFNDIKLYRDIESINAYDEYTKAGMIGKEEMLECLKVISRDNARTPMQWDNTINAGFTTGKPWIDVALSYQEINAKRQQNDPDSVLSYYIKLIEIRKNNEIITKGKFIPLLENDKNIYAYIRQMGEKKLTVLCNFSEEESDCKYADAAAKDLISNYKEHKQGKLMAYEARVLCS